MVTNLRRRNTDPTNMILLSVLALLAVLIAVMFDFLIERFGARLSGPRVLYEVTLPESSWTALRRFWESVGRL